MRVSVDTASQSVRSGDSAWPFRVDVRRGCAVITLEGVEYRVRPQSWQEKTRMARFTRLGESFIQSNFLDCCVTGGDGPIEAHHDILLALAMWINLPDEDTPGLPLDPKQLAGVTVEVCRSMGVGPVAIADLAVPEVESLWRSVNRESGWDGPRRVESMAQEFENKIVIVADAATSATPESNAAEIKQETGSEPQSAEGEPARRDAQEVVKTAHDAALPEVTSSQAAERKEASEEPKPVSRARFRVTFQSAFDERRPATAARISEGHWPGPGRVEPAAANAEVREQPMPGAPLISQPAASTTFKPQGTVENTWRPAAPEKPGRMPVDVSQAIAESSDWTPAFEAGRESEKVESVLDEFCQRLEEAAAEFGIIEEA